MQNDGNDSNQAEPRKESLVSAIISMVLLVALVFAFKSSILDANNIPSGSMIPTLKIGDYLFVNKMRYSLRIPFTEIEILRIDNPKRGDIITFIPPGFDQGKHYVKRVVGMPGDRIRIKTRGACELLKRMKAARKGGGSSDGKAPRSGLVASGLDKSAQRDFNCGGPGEPRDAREPRLDFIEYQKDGKGPWLNYLTDIVAADQAREILLDADDTAVLHPDIRPMRLDEDTVPVLFRESARGVSHLIVETNRPFYNPTYSTFCTNIDSDKGCRIPAGNYFVMGDNRDDSKDSRFIGLISRDKILGKALVIYFSINWYDKICKEYVGLPERVRTEGFKLPDFPPREQKKYCRQSDNDAEHESARNYFGRTIRNRIPRMNVRWRRLFTLLK